MNFWDECCPASDGEHMISLYSAVFAPADRGAYFHGEQVAVATLTMARIQEEVLAAGPPHVRSAFIDCAELQRRFGAGIGESCWREFAGKHMAPDVEATFERGPANHWGEIRERVCPAVI